MKITTFPGVYPPSEDTFYLADWLERKRLRGARVLDVGTGTGYLAVLAALRGARVTATDVDVKVVLNARYNARINGVRIRTVLSNLFENVEGTFDYIVFNPPYLDPWDELNDPSWDGSVDVVRRFLDEVEDYLSPEGCFALVLEENKLFRELFSDLKGLRQEKNIFHLVRVTSCP